MKIKLLSILIASCLLVGCITKTVPPTNIYTISPQWNDPHSLKADINNVFTLKLNPIRASRELKGTEILYTDNFYSQNSYAYSRWNDTPIKLLQTFFHIAIEEMSLYKAVIPSISVSKPDFILESTLLQLTQQLQKEGRSTGIIRIRFYLIDNKSREVLATKEFFSTAPVNNQNAKGAVEAINTAVVDVANKLVAWLAENDPSQ